MSLIQKCELNSEIYNECFYFLFKLKEMRVILYLTCTEQAGVLFVDVLKDSMK